MTDKTQQRLNELESIIVREQDMLFRFAYMRVGSRADIPSIAFEEMSGSAKGVTAAKVRGRKYIRNRGYGGGV